MSVYQEETSVEGPGRGWKRFGNPSFAEHISKGRQDDLTPWELGASQPT